MSENAETFEGSEGDITGAVDDVKSSVSKLAGEVKGTLNRSAQAAGEDVQRRAARVGEYAKERYGVAKDGLRSGYDRARKDFDQLSGDVNTYVRDNPGRSVLIAAGLGFVVGLLVRGNQR